MGGFLVLVGLGGFLFGIVNLIRPLGRLRIETRGQAGAVVAGSLVLVLIGGAVLPPNESDPEALTRVTTTAVSSTRAVVSSTSTPPVTSTTSSSTTPTSLVTSTTSAPSSTTTVGGGTLALDMLMTIPTELETPTGMTGTSSLTDLMRTVTVATPVRKC